MTPEAIKKAYRRYAQVYDAVFGPVLQAGRRRVLEALECRPGERVLEVGVGTGIALPLYPDYVRVTGIDVSHEMLERARRRIEHRGCGHVEALLEMDAEELGFPSASFDKVVAMYVVSVARHPARVLREMHRVCKPGGDIFVVNHFHSANPLLGRVEKLLSGFSSQLGFHPDFEMGELLDHCPVELVETSRVGGLWKMLRFRNASPLADAPGAEQIRLATP